MPVLALSGLFLYPAQGGPTICPFALVTGTACPGCGLTRAAAALMRGDLGLAWAYHPLVLVAGVWLAGMWSNWWRRQRGRPPLLPPRWVNGLLNGTAALFVLTWVARLATGTLPPV
ncbi:MAG: DUF2752 domain-containing protein [Actinomycetota bacterium]